MFKNIITFVAVALSTVALAEDKKFSPELELVAASGYELYGRTSEGEVVVRVDKAVSEATAFNTLVATGLVVSAPKVVVVSAEHRLIAVRVKTNEQVASDEAAWQKERLKLSPALALTVVADSKLEGTTGSGDLVFSEPESAGVEKALNKFIRTGRLSAMPRAVRTDKGKIYILVELKR